MKFNLIAVCFIAAIIVAQAKPFLPIIYAPTLGKLAIPATIAGGYIATGIVGGLAGALAVKLHEPGKPIDHWGFHDGLDTHAFGSSGPW